MKQFIQKKRSEPKITSTNKTKELPLKKEDQVQIYNLISRVIIIYSMCQGVSHMLCIFWTIKGSSLEGIDPYISQLFLQPSSN